MSFRRLFFNPLTVLVIIILVGFLVRLYKIDNPVADWHSWRQADTAAVSRNFFKEGFNPFIPKYDDISGVAENPEFNPGRYRFVEFPIYNSLVYFTYLLNGSVDEKLARLVSIFFSLGSTVFIYFITKRYFGKFTGMMAALIFAVLPYNIYFSRVILPEPSLVFFCLGMFYFLDRWIFEDKRNLFFWGLMFAICAFLTKPYAVFYGLPLFYSYYKKEGGFWPIHKRYLILVVSAILPFIFWRVWINQHPEGIPASKWLFNGNGIRLKPAFFRWIVGDRFGREILGVCGTFLFALGLLVKPKLVEGWLLHLLALSSFAYLVVLATGNVQHDYYQTLIIPALAIFTARGFVLLFEGIPNFLPRLWTIPVASLLLLLTFYLGWNEVKGLYQINNDSIVIAGEEADRVLPKDALVIAPYQGDTSFLYQTNRAGFPNVPLPMDELVSRFHISYYVSVNLDAKTKWAMRKYTVFEENSKFVIVDLTKLNPSFDAVGDKEPG